MRSKVSFKKNRIYTSTVMMLAILLGGNTHAEQPKIPFTYAKGVKLFQDNCAVCHGKWLEGTKQGPPLLHPFYKPSHHADPSFYRAALNGVKAHHWEFGDMPPVSGITKQDMDAIVPFIRWFQKEKGLF